MDFSAVTNKIKRVGLSNVRVVPMDGQSVMDGQHKIEIRENGSWTAVVSNITKAIAESVVAQAGNRVILG